MNGTDLNIGGILGCFAGAVLMWSFFKKASDHVQHAWRNDQWLQDISDLRFLSAGLGVAFCVAAGLMANRL